MQTPDDLVDATSSAKAAPASLGDLVDSALAAALERAAGAGQWSTVAILAGELAARRVAREAPPGSAAVVVDLAAERRKRGEG